MLTPWLRGTLPAAPGVGTVLMRADDGQPPGVRSPPAARGPAAGAALPPDMGILDWHRHTELMDRTYRWAMHELARLKAVGHPALDTSLGRPR
jgi:hypothetical protein